jgi:prepilin-type N-terminal cleavage/methylation domain-containing protein
MNALLSKFNALVFCHPELVEGSVPFAFFNKGELILRQAQDDSAIKRNFAARRPQVVGFTLLEMMITLAVFVLLAAAVFGLMTGVLQSTSTLQDNSNRRDQIEALNAYLKNQLGGMSATGTLASYQRGDGEGLTQNGIIFGNPNRATAIDAKIQSNGYYALRLTTFTTSAGPDQPQDARQVLQQAVTTDDPSLIWSSLMGDIKTLHWKFQNFNVTQWLDLWSGGSKPNLVEFSLQPAADLQPTTMDFWLPKINSAATAGAPPPPSP